MSTASARRVGKLWSWQRWGIYLSLLICALTGMLWFIWRDVLMVTPNSNDRLVLVMHGAGGFLTLMAFGSVLPTHVRATWRARKNRISGGLVIAMFTILALTALCLYYGSEETHTLSKWVHIAVGLMAIACFPLHILMGRRKGYPMIQESIHSTVQAQHGNHSS